MYTRNQFVYAIFLITMNYTNRLYFKNNYNVVCSDVVLYLLADTNSLPNEYIIVNYESFSVQIWNSRYPSRVQVYKTRVFCASWVSRHSSSHSKRYTTQQNTLVPHWAKKSLRITSSFSGSFYFSSSIYITLKKFVNVLDKFFFFFHL